MTHKPWCWVLCSLLLSLSCAALVYGQAVRGTLLGTITDSSGAVVPGAKVAITEMNTGLSRSADTNQSGNYVFPNLPVGTYRVSVEQPGFRRAVREGVGLLADTTVRVDLVLQPGAVTETISVTAEAPLLESERADTGRKIEFNLAANLPLPNNRNFQSLLNLVPGASRAFRPHSEFFNSQDSLSTNVNGQSRMANNEQLEGVDNNHRTGLLTVLIPPIEAVAEVDVSTSNYEAELGRAGGAVVNVILRSGTNSLHGSVYEFNKVSALAARNFFANSKAPTTYNLYGFTLGGPIKRNKTFFFGDFQGIKDRRGDVTLATIPSLAFRTGDLSASSTTIYDPKTGDANGRGRTPFKDNVIPDFRISDIAKRILALIPPPTSPGLGTNYQKNTVRKKDTNFFDVKIDHQFNDRNRLSARYSYMKPTVEQPPVYGLPGGPTLANVSGSEGFAGTGTDRTQSAGFNYTHLFSAKFIAEARAGVSRYRNDAQNTDIGTNAADAIGIKGANLSRFTSGMTEIRINGYSRPVLGYSGSLPWARAETNFNFVSIWTRIWGNHTVKWGAAVRRIRDELLQTQPIGPRGRLPFTEGPTALNGDPKISFANAFASFLLDLPNSFGRDLPVIFPAFRQTALFTYLQDKWQVSPKLTLDIGVRHELWPPATPRFPAGFSNYDPSTNTLVLAGVGGHPKNLGRETYYRSFAPRFGAAYRLNEKTVIRGGFGISIVPFPDNNYAYNFPVRQNNAFNALNTFSAAGSMAAGFPAPQVAVIPPDGVISKPPASDYDVIPLDYKEGYVESWNVAVQRALPKNFALEAAYVGNHGVRINAVRNLNAGVPGKGAAGQPQFQQFGRTASTNLRFDSTSTSYHSLQVKFDRRFSGGFMMTTAYTFSKSIDYVNDNGSYHIHIFPRMNRGRSNFDRTHIFVQSYVYELPFGPKRRWLRQGAWGWIAGGWQVNGAFTSQTGTPLNITFDGATLNAPKNGNRPNLNGKPQISGGVGSGAFWFDTTKFSPPPTATFGTAGRNLLNGPGLVNLDFSLFRKFPVTERVGVEFRFESLNFTNTPHFNFDNPNGEFGNANFGHVTTALLDQRQIQFGLKVVF